MVTIQSPESPIRPDCNSRRTLFSYWQKYVRSVKLFSSVYFFINPRNCPTISVGTGSANDRREMTKNGVNQT